MPRCCAAALSVAVISAGFSSVVLTVFEVRRKFCRKEPGYEKTFGWSAGGRLMLCCLGPEPIPRHGRPEHFGPETTTPAGCPDMLPSGRRAWRPRPRGFHYD